MDLMTRARTQWDRLLAVGFTIAGAVALTTGWLGVSGTAYPAEQMPYVISAGLGGLFLLGVAAVLWLSADLHDEWRKLDRIERALLTARSDADPVIDEPQTIDETRELAAVGVETPS